MALVDDAPGQRQPRVGVRDPQGLIAEQFCRELPTVSRAGQRIDRGRVGVDDDPLRQQRVEDQLDRGTPMVGLVQPRLHADAQHFLTAGQRGRVRGGHHGKERLHHERHQRAWAEGRERNAARLDVQHPVRLAGAVSAAAPRVRRVAPEVARQGRDLGEQLSRGIRHSGSGGLRHRRPYNGPKVAHARWSAPSGSAVPRRPQALGRKRRSSATLCMETGIRSIEAIVMRSGPMWP